jgi:hypothetical protein
MANSDHIEAWGGPLDGRTLPLPWGKTSIPVDWTTTLGRCTGDYVKGWRNTRQLLLWIPGITIMFKP